LLLAAGVAGLAWADLPQLRGIGRTLSTVRDKSVDAALQAKVRSALALSRRISGMKIGVETRAGIVDLSGRVPTQEARSIVEAIVADTPGVGGVRNELVVDPSATANGYEQTLLQRIADLETQVAVQERLRREPLLSGENVRVDVDRGVVALRGRVGSELERDTAQTIAEAAVGAEHVRNELDALSTSDRSEDRLARRIEFELYSTGAFDLSRIQVTTDGSRVRLQGVARSEAERLLAARLAETVPGVRSVVNDLSIAEKATPS
jgi:osmotically-inducible protein OsmY